MFIAKFRVLEKNEHFITTYDDVEKKSKQEKRVLVKFWPVTAKNQWSTSADECEENRAFWEATPSGECQLDMMPEEAASYEGSACYFIRFQPAAEGTWHLSNDAFSHGWSPQTEIVLHPSQGSGTLKMWIQQPETQLRLVEVIAAAKIEQLREKVAGKDVKAPRWSVVFEPAPGVERVYPTSFSFAT